MKVLLVLENVPEKVLCVPFYGSITNKLYRYPKKYHSCIGMVKPNISTYRENGKIHLFSKRNLRAVNIDPVSDPDDTFILF